MHQSTEQHGGCAGQAPEKQTLVAAMQSMQDLGQQDFAARAVRIMDELKATTPGRLVAPCVMRVQARVRHRVGISWGLLVPGNKQLITSSQRRQLRDRLQSCPLPVKAKQHAWQAAPRPAMPLQITALRLHCQVL